MASLGCRSSKQYPIPPHGALSVSPKKQSPLPANLAKTLAIVDWVLLLIPIVWFHQAPIPRLLSLDTMRELLKVVHFSIIIWSCTMSVVKTSIALTLLRFLNSPWWRGFLYGIIALQGIAFVANALFLLLVCRPLHLVWDPLTTLEQCPLREKQRVVSETMAGFHISTDIILSLAPLAFIVKLHRPLLERIFLGVLMAIGLVASAASFRKTLSTRQFSDLTIDLFAVSQTITTWTIAEMYLAILAACLPVLKVPLQKIFEALGMPIFRTTVARTSQVKASYKSSERPTLRSLHLSQYGMHSLQSVPDDEADREEVPMKELGKVRINQFSSSSRSMDIEQQRP